MKKLSIFIVVILLLCIAVISYMSLNRSNIKAEYYNISYGNSYYEGIDKVEQETTDMLVNDYNKIKLFGTTNQEINYDKAISITFVNNDQISGQVTVDDKGVCCIGNKPGNNIIDEESNIYEDAIKAYEELKGKWR